MGCLALSESKVGPRSVGFETKLQLSDFTDGAVALPLANPPRGAFGIGDINPCFLACYRQRPGQHKIKTVIGGNQPTGGGRGHHAFKRSVCALERLWVPGGDRKSVV